MEYFRREPAGFAHYGLSDSLNKVKLVFYDEMQNSCYKPSNFEGNDHKNMSRLKSVFIKNFKPPFKAGKCPSTGFDSISVGSGRRCSFKGIINFWNHFEDTFSYRRWWCLQKKCFS